MNRHRKSFKIDNNKHRSLRRVGETETDVENKRLTSWVAEAKQKRSHSGDKLKEENSCHFNGHIKIISFDAFKQYQ